MSQKWWLQIALVGRVDEEYLLLGQCFPVMVVTLTEVKKNKEQAENLMELGERTYLASHIDEFDSSLHKYIAERFLEA